MRIIETRIAAIVDGEEQIIVAIGSNSRKAMATRLGIEPAQLNQLLYAGSLAKSPPNKTKEEIKAIDDAKEITELKKKFPILSLPPSRKEIFSAQVVGSDGKAKLVEIEISGGTVGIKVDGTFSRKSPQTDRDGIKIALTARRLFNEAIAKMPDGSVLRNKPFTDDGLGDKRRSLYELAGFSKGSKSKEMMGVVRNGKIVPIEANEYKRLSDSGYVTKTRKTSRSLASDAFLDSLADELY